MALVTTVTNTRVVGTEKQVRGTFAFDSSYPTGGEAVALGDMGLTFLNEIVIPNNSGYSFEYDYTNNKAKVYRGDNTNAAAAPSVEVSNAVDLSSLTAVRFTARGH